MGIKLSRSDQEMLLQDTDAAFLELSSLFSKIDFDDDLIMPRCEMLSQLPNNGQLINYVR